MSDQHTTVQYQLRLPEKLRDEIKDSAKTHNRSMNADIVARLEESFEPASIPSSFGLEKMELISKVVGASYMLMLQERIDNLNDDEALEAVRGLIKEVSEDYKHLIDNVGGLRSNRPNQ